MAESTEDIQQLLRMALGGEYKLTDGRVFWMDNLAVNEILRRLEQFEFRLK